MNCKCGGRIKITHSYRAGSGSKTAGGTCRACGKKHTIVSFILGEVGEDCGGAYATATALKNGTGPRIVT